MLFRSYKCPKLADVMGRLLGTNAIIDAVSSHPEWKKGARQFFNPDGHVFSEDNVRAFLQSSELSGDPEIRRLRRVLGYRSAGIDRLVAHVAYVDSAIAPAQKRGFTGGADMSYLFLVKGAFPVLFLTDNPSIMPRPVSIFAPRAQGESTSSPFRTYSSLRENAQDRETVLRSLRTWIDLHASLGQVGL